MRIRIWLLVMFGCMLFSAPGLAQTQDHKPVEATSATDQDVRLHNTRKIFRFHRKFKAEERATESKVTTRSKRYAVEARATERPGRSISKSSPVRSHSGNQARVFKRHGSSVSRNAERVRRANRRQMLE